MKYSLPAFGSLLEITLGTCSLNDSGITESFSMVQDFENKYSRFIKGNKLAEINTNKTILLDPEISSLIRLCLRVSGLTEGAFDITLLPLLENAGYGISDIELTENIGYQNILLEADTLHLKKGIQIEFGSFGKGYMLDLVSRILSKSHAEFTVNFGGDIRVKWEQKVLLEDPLDIEKTIWEMTLRDMALASSAGNKRKFWKGHHLMNAKQQTSQNDKLTVYVSHRLGVMADIFATALFVTPLRKSLEILEKTDGLEALIISKEWKIFQSKGFEVTLNI